MENVVTKCLNLHAFLSTAVNFDEVEKMSRFEKVGNILLAPHRFVFCGVDAKYNKTNLKITPAYAPSTAVKVLRIAAHIILTFIPPVLLLLITTSLVGGVAKLIGRYRAPNPQADEVEIADRSFSTRHRAIVQTLLGQINDKFPENSEIKYAALPRYTLQPLNAHRNSIEDLRPLRKNEYFPDDGDSDGDAKDMVISTGS